MNPYPLPPKITMAEGWNNGYVVGIPALDKGKKTAKGTANILRVRLTNVEPDAAGQVLAQCKADLFLYEDVSGGGSNYMYSQFLKALGIQPEKVIMGSGSEMEIWPDPDPKAYAGKFIRFNVVHRLWEGRDGMNTDAEARGFEPWDGVMADGTQYEGPVLDGSTSGASDDDKDLPF